MEIGETIRCGLPFLIRQIHVGLPFLSCRCLSSHAVLLQASSARTMYPRASSAVASLEYRYSPTWMTEADGARADRGHRDHKAMHWARYSLGFLLRDAMPVRVCKILDVDATIATNASSVVLRGCRRFIQPRIRRGDEEDAVIAVKRRGGHLVILASYSVDDRSLGGTNSILVPSSVLATSISRQFSTPPSSET